MTLKSTRERILHTLLTHPKSTIDDLAIAVDINPISVRHHLSSLQADGLVFASEERHGVGRPRLVYSLTEQGIEQFPTRYLKLTDRLLNILKTTLPEPVFNRLFLQMANELSKDQTLKVKFLSLEERLDFIKEFLAHEGYTVEWEKQGDQYIINTTSCPYYHISQNHPEICSIDQHFMSTLLAVPINKVKCVQQGDTFCSYAITLSKNEPNS